MPMDILFIAHNTHQKRYFEILSNNLKFNSQVVVSPIAICKPEPIELEKKFQEIEKKYRGVKLALYKKYLLLESKFILCGYKKLIDRYNPKLLGIWNGVKYPQSLSQKFPMKKIYFENGFLPNTTQVDCRGVNALNSVPRDPDFYRQFSYYKHPLPQTLIPRSPVRKLEGEEIKLSGRKYIFIPFQVNYDSQIIYFSPWIKSMEHLFQVINKIATQFPNLDFIFKPHPSDRVSTYTHLFSQTQKNLFFATNPTQELIENAQAIITINSSVGVESLLFNKKVITLGEAFYNIPGIVKHATNLEELRTLIGEIDKWKVDQNLIKNFLGYLYYQYLIPDSWKKPSQKHFSKIEERIEQCLQ